MTEINLKPCPFCAGEATLVYNDDDKTWQVVCDNCCSCSDYYDETWNPDNEVIDAWNNRPIESKLKSDNVKLMMTNKLLKKRVNRLEEVLEVILDATKDEKPCITAINVVAYMALKEKNND